MYLLPKFPAQPRDLVNLVGSARELDLEILARSACNVRGARESNRLSGAVMRVEAKKAIRRLDVGELSPVGFPHIFGWRGLHALTIRFDPKM